MHGEREPELLQGFLELRGLVEGLVDAELAAVVDLASESLLIR